MGGPVTVEIVGSASQTLFDEIFSYFHHIDETFSTYKESSEITAINKGTLDRHELSEEMKEVFRLAEETKYLTNGYFNIRTPSGSYDPSGLVKGWAVFNAAKILRTHGVDNFYVEAAGDIQTAGLNSKGESWIIGIQNPFHPKRQVVKVMRIKDRGVATSGSYARGAHIYNPVRGVVPNDIVSMTVVGPNVYEADRFATAAFAMGKDGINFIEKLDGFEGYSIDKTGRATMTSNFNHYA